MAASGQMMAQRAQPLQLASSFRTMGWNPLEFSSPEDRRLLFLQAVVQSRHSLQYSPSIFIVPLNSSYLALLFVQEIWKVLFTQIAPNVKT